MSELDVALNELVMANRILAREDVVDAYGHVTMRHPGNPNRYLMSRSLAPELVEKDDLLEFTLEGELVGGGSPAIALERMIHGAIYLARPDIFAVVHAHAEDTLPFGITDVPLRPVIHSGSFIGGHVPVWDIADKFGETDLLVKTLEQGQDLARTLANNNVTLMRGHGFAAGARSLIDVVRLCVYLPRNARVQMAAMQMGKIKPLSEGEIASRAAGYQPYGFQTQRTWQYWAHRAGCSHLVAEVKKPEK